MTIKKNEITKSEEVSGLIQFLGDIAIKASRKHETEAARSGIDSLTEIALKFLELKNKKNDIQKTKKIIPAIGESQNLIIDSVLDAFDKAFSESISNPDSIISRHLIFQLFAILNKTLSGSNNWLIIEKLIETRNVSGTTYSKLMRYCLENQASVESNILTQHLASVPQRAILEGKYDIQYITTFIEYHIYRLTKLIIEYNNFQSFDNELDHFFNSLQFRDPEEIAGRITGNIYMLSTIDMSETGKQKTEELVFNIEFVCFKDFNTYFKVLEMIEEYKQLLLKKFEGKKDEFDTISQRIDLIKELLKEFYISLLIHAVFFRIGALLISKGSSFNQYIEDLWHHGKSKSDSINIINSTPVSESIKWNTLYTIYSGYGSSIDTDFYTFENFSDWDLYHYQYCALMLIKSANTFSFDFDKLKRLQSENKQDQFLFYYELLH